MSSSYREQRAGRAVIGWNADVLAEMPSADFFDPLVWQQKQAVTGQAMGRGRAWFIDAGDGRHWVLRHNRRGGALARINHDRYLWTGAARVRSLKELRLLAAMSALGLPVPRPVAARAVRQGLFYRADLVMETIADAAPLADVLARRAMAVAEWHRLGTVLATFHRAGIWHGDLNARNILIDAQGAFHLIDFDKAGRRSAGSWQQANLARLHRSLTKCLLLQAEFCFAERDWLALNAGYDSVFAGSL